MLLFSAYFFALVIMLSSKLKVILLSIAIYLQQKSDIKKNEENQVKKKAQAEAQKTVIEQIKIEMAGVK